MTASPQNQSSLCEQCGGPLSTKGTAMLCASCVAQTLFGEPDEEAEEEAPDRIGPFKLMEKLGEGAFGVVYHALQVEPVNREVALKVLKPGMDSLQVIARFEAERQALALMDHTDISTVYAAGQTEKGRPYFAMELVHGLPLTDFCEKHRLDLPARLGLFARICGAIEHAHQKGIIHRDLKPTNLLVAGDAAAPQPKVIDFGIAKATEQSLDGGTLLTGRGQLLGTPEYMSPEQATLGKTDVDTRADVYALGMVLYELLAGAPAWSRETFGDHSYDELLRTIREGDPRPPSARQPRLPVDLDWIVLKAIDKDRRRRYGSAAALADDVARFLAHEPVRARPPSTAYRVSRFVRKHRAGVIFACAIALTLAAGAAIATAFALKANRERIAAEELRAQSRRDFSLADLRIANEISTTGRHSAAVAHLCRALRNDPENRPAQQKLIHELAYRGFPVAAGDPLMIGGDWIGSGLLAGNRLVTATRGAPATLWQLGDQIERLAVELPIASGFVGSRGGGRFALAAADGSAWQCFGRGGEQLGSVDKSLDLVAMSADGNRLYGSDASGIHCYDCGSGKLLWHHPAEAPVTVLSAPATGTTMGAGFADGRILVLFSTGKVGLERQLPGGSAVRLLEIARGTVLAAGALPSAYLWDRKADAPAVIELRERPDALAISADADFAAVAAGESIITHDGAERHELELPRATRLLRFSPGSATLYAASTSGTVARIDPSAAREIGAPLQQRQPVAAMHFDEGSHLVITATTNGSLHRWQLGSRSAQVARFGHGGKPLLWASFTLSSSNLATGALDGQIQFWWPDGKRWVKFDSTEKIPLSYTQSGKILLFHSGRSELNAWDSVTFKDQPAVKMRSPPLAGALRQDAEIAVTSSSDGSIALLDLQGSRLLHRWETSAPPLDRTPWDELQSESELPAAHYRDYVHLSADGEYAAVANGANQAYILQLSPPYSVIELPHSAPVRWISIDQLKQKVATGSADNTARVWAFPSGRPLTPPLRHEESSPERGIITAFSNDGRRLVTSGSFDSSARVWDIATGQLAIDPLPHDGVVSAINISPDSRTIATGGSDGIVRLWDSDTGALVAPLFDLGATVPELFFETPHGLRLFAYNVRGECAVFELVPRDFAMQPWFLDFAESLGGLRFNERDVLVPSAASELERWRQRLSADSSVAGTSAGLLAEWLVTPSTQRERTPFVNYWDIGFKWRTLEELGESRREALQEATGK